jgi:predicted transcriptional regulator
MKLRHWKSAAGLDERMQVRNKLRVLVAAIGTLAAVFGIGIAVNGLIEFNSSKVIVGACVIAVSTVTYIVMLTRAS